MKLKGYYKLLIICLPLLSSCANYTMSREQLYVSISAAHPVQVGILSHGNVIGHYTSNGVKEIVCVDKHGKTVGFPNSPKVEMRITDTRGRRHIFYFDSFILRDSTFTGLNSRLLGTTKSIYYADIKKVELQKGAKRYKYVATPAPKSPTDPRDQGD